MIRTKYEQTKIADMPAAADAQNTLNVFSIETVDRSGIFRIPGDMYSKTYKLSDINFAGVTEDEQKDLIIGFSKVLRSIPCRFSYSIANEYVDEKSFYDRVLCKKQGDKNDHLRDSMNRIIRDKLSDARQGLYQSIYLTLTIKAESIRAARADFLSMEGAIRSAFMGLGRSGVQGCHLSVLSTDERLNLLCGFSHASLVGKKSFSYQEAICTAQDPLTVISPAYMQFGNESFSLNRMTGKVWFIDDYPKSLEADILTGLSRLNVTSFVTVNNELLDLAAFKQEISRKYMKVGMKIEGEKQRNRNNNDYLSDASQKLLNEKEKLDRFLKEMDSRDDHYFNTTMLVMVLAKDEDELARVEEKLKNFAALKSFSIKGCFSRQREALNSALFLGVQEFKRVVNLSSSCLAMFIPFKTQELFDEGGIYYGINQLSQNAIFADKKLLKNHNGLILGQSGSGKSTFTKVEILLIFLTYLLDQVIIVDPQSEYGDLADAVDGTVICFDSGKEFYINPMDISFMDVDYATLREIISEKSDFILTLISSLIKRDILPEEQGIIDKVVDKVYSENYSIRRKLSGLADDVTEFEVPAFMKTDRVDMVFEEGLSEDEQVRAYSPTLLDVYQGLLDEGSDLAKSLAAALEIFVNGSLNMFNHKTNVDLSNRMVVFDLSGIKENLRVTGMLIMMETVRRKIKSGAKNGQWTHLYIDELHELLGVDQVAGFILKLWKEIRKMNGIMNGITQNMSDILNEENAGRLSAIFSNTEYFALLSQSSLDKKKLMTLLPEISEAMFNFVDNAQSGTGLLKMGNVTLPFDMRMNKDSEIYRIVNTDGGSYGV